MEFSLSLNLNEEVRKHTLGFQALLGIGITHKL